MHSKRKKVFHLRTILLLLISSTLVLTNSSSSASEQDFNPHENCPERFIPQDLMPDNIFNGERAGTLGWCFAHSAADILSYKLGKKMSVHDVATYFFNSEIYQQNIKSGVERIFKHPAGGHSLWALNALQGKPVCLEKDTDFYHGNWQKMASKIQEFSSVNLAEQMSSLDTADFMDQKKRELFRFSPEERLTQLFENSCRKNGVVIDYSSTRIRSWGFNALELEDFVPGKYENYTMINESLIKALRPVSIGFDVSMLFEGREDILHAATLIGQQKINGICMYKLRNNSGKTCKMKTEKLVPGVICDENSDVYYVDRERALPRIMFGAWFE